MSGLMSRIEALNLIQQSDAERFDVKPKKAKRCDLCRKECVWDFYITSVKLTKYIDIPENLKGENSHVTKHICKDCFVRLFGGEK